MINIEEVKLADEEHLNRAKGCIVGAFCGDAIGAAVEFRTDTITSEEVEKAMKMTMVGPHGILPTQITDDGELALCLLHGLLESPDKELNTLNIAKYYQKWIQSSPFNIGKTIGNAFNFLKTKEEFKADDVREEAKKVGDSESNGSLMRITPLAVYLSLIEDNKIMEEAVCAEVSLTHSNEIVQYASIAYCIAIRELINGKGRKEAYETAKNWGLSKNNEKFTEWFNLIDNRVEYNTIHRMGWVKIGFLYSFFYLLENKSYYESVSSIIQKGGDTDTNAAIVSGMIGAAEGFSKIPEDMTNKMLSCDTSLSKEPRPDFLSPFKCDLLKLIEQLFKKRPNTLTKIV